MKAHYVCSGVGTSPQVAKLAGGLTVYDGAIVMLDEEAAKKINSTAKLAAQRAKELAKERGDDPPEVAALTVRKAPRSVVEALEDELEVEEIAASVDVRTPEEKIQELVEGNSREKLNTLAAELEIDAPESFKDKASLAGAIVGYGNPTSG